jgi:hypothetical protein
VAAPRVEPSDGLGHNRLVDNEGRLRAERYAENEALFREVNERIRELSEPWTSNGDRVEFTCECANLGCAERIAVLLKEYEEVRSYPDRFLVAPGHLDLEVEDIVTEHDGFWVVEKRGHAGATAAELDPRT